MGKVKEYRLNDGKLPYITWRDDVSEAERRQIEALALPELNYRELVKKGDRPESCHDIHDHIWDEINEHLRTNAYSFHELVEQLGIMRYGHRPQMADTFCGSGQIPFEAARLGCNVYASDLNPVSCMLTWGAFNIVGGSSKDMNDLIEDQRILVEQVTKEIDKIQFIL